ncbi:hypothetical protein MYU51_002401 [Penicillium brevicompactum]|uniref:uncharacterized protein n=1 Tax=Penicillium brevicompactum TaxID=5074 RepID=UPI0025416DF2|nr:uncharacterized protein N7506_003604 [Penicillium brevicompactum]KAJ5343780.1 hypothetical protein N7506_003604 [Penicillium brevicompactum]
MIIYTDALTGDELVADTFDLKPNPLHPILWECDCRKYSKRVGGEDIQLEGANPSAEEAEEDSGEHEMKMVHDIEDQFRLQWLQDSPPSKDLFKNNLKNYLKRINKEVLPNLPEKEQNEFKDGAAKAMKYLVDMHGDLDFMVGEGPEAHSGQYVLINFREDGVTPYAIVWKHGLKETKV